MSNQFSPSKPGSEPLETSGHQIGQMVGNDAAPEFHAKVLPAGSAPASKTFEPNPENEVPGQADNELAGQLDGKEDTRTDALDMPGATSGDVHTGIGHPGSGQEKSGKNRRDGGERQQPDIAGKHLGGSGLTGDTSTHAERLLDEHQEGPASAREHNVSLDGAETKESVGAEQLASDNRDSQKRDYDRTAESAPGKHS